jgi:hypothetical protein
MAWACRQTLQVPADPRSTEDDGGEDSSSGGSDDDDPALQSKRRRTAERKAPPVAANGSDGDCPAVRVGRQQPRRFGPAAVLRPRSAMGVAPATKRKRGSDSVPPTTSKRGQRTSSATEAYSGATVGRRLQYLFETAAGEESESESEEEGQQSQSQWVGGRVTRLLAAWPGWAAVRFDDGDGLEVHLNRSSEGTAWHWEEEESTARSEAQKEQEQEAPQRGGGGYGSGSISRQMPCFKQMSAYCTAQYKQGQLDLFAADEETAASIAAKFAPGGELKAVQVLKLFKRLRADDPSKTREAGQKVVSFFHFLCSK